MNKQETAQLIGMLYSYYPNAKLQNATPEGMVTAWYLALREYNYRDVEDVMVSLVKTSKFMPSVAEFCAALKSTAEPERLSADAAWALVRRAASNGSYGSEEEFAKLPPEVKRLVHDPATLRAYAVMPEDTLESVVGSTFKRSFRAWETRREQLDALPESAKQRLNLGELLKPLPEVTPPQPHTLTDLEKRAVAALLEGEKAK